MDDADRRRRKGLKAASILKEVLQGRDIRRILDVGCSNSIFLDVVIHELQAPFGLGIDLDADALPKPSLHRAAVVADALSLPVADSSIDLVICNHTYEHVPDARVLFQEIRRVLTVDGVVYFSAMNSRWPIEPHYHLPLIHWLPYRWSAVVMRLFGYQSGYLEQPLNYTKLRQLVQDFDLCDYTLKVIEDPKQYQAEDVVYPKIARFVYPLARLFYSILPGYLWVLVKR
jgi:SAM-dependent methyltransferase